MILEHQHFPPQLKQSKRKIIITRDRPFVVVLSDRFPFLNTTITSIIREHGYACTLKRSQQKQVMGYRLPILCCEDVVLEKQALIQFLADITLSQYPFDEYMLRKANFVKLYKAWFHLLNSQFQQSSTLPNIEELTKDEYTNRAFEEFINLSIFVVNKGYERTFHSYQSQQFNVQSVFLTDVTDTILKQFPRTRLDYVLRGYFSSQIDFSSDYKQKLNDRMRNDDPVQATVLMEGKEPKTEDFPLINTNVKWFTGILVGLSFLFAQYGQ